MAISDEEVERIKTELSLDVSGYSNRIECPRCGHSYGMCEFLKQGIEEHGREVVDSVFSLKDVCVIRVNATQIPVCRNCRQTIIVDRANRTMGHWYECREYGCCDAKEHP